MLTNEPLEYDESVGRVRDWGINNPNTLKAIADFGIAGYGTWLLVDGTWLDAPEPHSSVGVTSHEFMQDTGSLRWNDDDLDPRRLNLEMVGVPTVDQMISVNAHLSSITGTYVLIVDLTQLQGGRTENRVRQLGTKMLVNPSTADMAEVWVWVETVYGWKDGAIG